MNRQQGEALDRYLTTSPEDCDEDGHDLVPTGRTEDGCQFSRCRRCGKEFEE